METVTKYIKIDFVDPLVNAFNDLKYIEEAVFHASGNLRNKHGIDVNIFWDAVYDTTNVILKLDIPKKISDTFSYGPHLKGIAGYLLKTYPSKYVRYLKGKRLLSYKEVTILYRNNDKSINNVNTARKWKDMSEEEMIVEYINVMTVLKPLLSYFGV